MLPDAVHVQPDLIRQLDLGQQVAEALRGLIGGLATGLRPRLCEGEDAEFHAVGRGTEPLDIERTRGVSRQRAQPPVTLAGARSGSVEQTSTLHLPMTPLARLTLVCLAGSFCIGATYIVHSASTGARPGYTGAPREGATTGTEQTCNTCHTGGNATLLSVSGPDTYTPGMPISLQISGVVGFEVTVRDANENFVGSFTASTGTQAPPSTRTGYEQAHYLTHTAPGSSWTVNWTPPASDVGNVTFYVTGVGPRSGGSTSGATDATTKTFAFQSGVDSESGAEAPAFAVRAASSNPARGALALALEVPAPTDVTLDIFDVRGRLVLTRTETVGASGDRVHLRGLRAGAYLVRARAIVGGAPLRADGRFVVVD